MKAFDAITDVVADAPKHNPDINREEAQEKVLHEILNPQRNQESEHSHG